MMAWQLLLLVVAMVVGSCAGQVQYSVTIKVPGTPGSNVFLAKIGKDKAISTMSAASSFIWNTFKQAPTDRKSITSVTLTLESSAGIAKTAGNNIYFNDGYLAEFQGDVVREFSGIIFHEMTHVWQWSGNNPKALPLVEGIADYIRLKVGLGAAHWVKPGQGERWDQGYDVTARFLDYCESVRNGFVAEMNNKLKNSYSEGYFVDITGKTVHQLWNDYKSKYGGGLN